MKPISIILLLNLLTFESFGQLDSTAFRFEKNMLTTDSLKLSFFSAFNFNLFIGKPIDSMLNAIPFPVEEIIFINSMRGRLRKSFILFSEKIDIEVEVHKYQFIVERNPKGDYIPCLFRRETLEGILLFYDNKIVKIVPLE